MASRGGYYGGSTLIRPGSDWFSYRKPRPAKRMAENVPSDPNKLTKAQKKAQKKAVHAARLQQQGLKKTKRLAAVMTDEQLAERASEMEAKTAERLAKRLANAEEHRRKAAVKMAKVEIVRITRRKIAPPTQ